MLAEIIDSLELPPGAFNLVTGFGPVVGEAIAAHDGIDMVSFTGSTRAGRRVSEVAAGTVKVSLELGGKSANVILDDADLKAISHGVPIASSTPARPAAPTPGCWSPARSCRRRRRSRPLRPRSSSPAIRSTLDEARAAGLRGTARPGSRLHREGHRGGREARHRRRRGAGGTRARLLRPPDRLLRGEAGDDDRPGGDLRAGALDHPLRLRG